MKITILTLFPEMFEGFFNSSIIKKAKYKGLVEYQAIDVRSLRKTSTTGWMTIRSAAGRG